MKEPPREWTFYLDTTLAKTLNNRDRKGISEKDFSQIEFTGNKFNMPMVCYYLFYALTGITLPLNEEKKLQPPRLVYDDAYLELERHLETYDHELDPDFNRRMQRLFSALSVFSDYDIKWIGQHYINSVSWRTQVQSILGHKQDFIQKRIFSVMTEMCPEYNNNKSKGIRFHEFMSFMTRTVFHPDKRQ